MRKDWVECKIGEIFTTITGNTPSKKEIENYESKDIPFVKPPDVTNGILSNVTEFISTKAKNKARLLPVNSVLVTCIGNLGRVSINTNFEVAFNQQINAVIPNSFTLPKFYFYNFQSSLFRNRLEELSTSTTVALVNKSNFDIIDVPLIPLPEQRAIVKKIEALFSSLDAGIADLKKAQDQLKIYRQAVLKKAFEGITNFIELGNAGEWKGGGTPSTRVKEYWEEGNVLWVSSQDVKSKYITDTERKITEIAIENSSTKWVESGSLLFVVRSGILRRIFPIAIAKTRLCVNQDIQTVHLSSKWNNEFVYWYLECKEYDIRHTCAKDGTTVESVDVQKLKNYKIPVTSLDEQAQIVKEIESRLSVCDAVEQQIKDSLSQAEALRQSILKKAFEGKLLTEEEIKACQLEADYEPAAVLLEKIKAEKVASRASATMRASKGTKRK